jgi:hypothetical protein
MALTEAQMAKVRAAILSRGVLLTCPLCGLNNRWNLGDGIAAVPVQEKPADLVGAQPPARYLPLFELVCTNCGGVQFISTTMLAWLTDLSDMLPSRVALPERERRT